MLLHHVHCTPPPTGTGLSTSGLDSPWLGSISLPPRRYLLMHHCYTLGLEGILGQSAQLINDMDSH